MSVMAPDESTYVSAMASEEPDSTTDKQSLSCDSTVSTQKKNKPGRKRKISEVDEEETEEELIIDTPPGGVIVHGGVVVMMMN